MKKALLFFITVICCCLSYNQSYAQAFQKGVKVFSFGVGGSNFIRFWGDDYYGYNGTYSLATFQLNIQGEFGVHEYVGVGFTTGFGGRGGSYFYGSEINFPIGVTGNFHFWQLIDDKSGNDLHADKLDLYGGLNIGSGIAAQFYDAGDGSDVVPLLFVGPQVGVRYYFSDVFGVNAELGYGKSWVNVGVVLKID